MEPIAPSGPRSLGESQLCGDDVRSDSDGNQRGTDLQFITITHPSEIHTRNNQRCVRSNAIRSLRQERRYSFPPAPVERSPLAILRPRPKAAGGRAHAKVGAQGKVRAQGKAGAQAQAGVQAQAGAETGVLQRHAAAQDSLYNLFLPRPYSSKDNERDEEIEEYWQYALALHGSEGSHKQNLSLLHYEDPVCFLGAGRLDPFMTSPIKHYPYMDELIDHYATVLAPSHLPIPVPLNPLVTILIPFAREHPVVFHAILTVAGGNLTISRGGRVPTQRELFHRGETCRLLNKMLRDPKQATSIVVVAAILNVSGHDILFGQHDAHEMHWQGLDHILKVRGGFNQDGIEEVLQRQMMWSTHFRAMRESSSSRLTSSTDESISSSVDPSPFIDGDKDLFTAGLRELADSAYIDRPLMDSIMLMRSLAHIFHDRTPANNPEAKANVFNDQRAKVEIQLDALRLKSKESIGRSIEECICLTTIIFDHTAMRRMPLASFTMTDLAKDLKLALTRTDLSHCWGTNYKALIWVCCVANIATVDVPDKFWYAGILRDAASCIQTTLDWVTILDILKEFLWCENYNGATAEMWSLSQARVKGRASI